MLLGVMAALRLLLLATQQPAMPATNRTKLLFVDTALFAQQIGSMELGEFSNSDASAARFVYDMFPVMSLPPRPPAPFMRRMAA